MLLLLGALTLFPIVVAIFNDRAALGALLALGALEFAVLIGLAVWLHRHPMQLVHPASRVTATGLGWIAALAFPLSGMIAVSPEAGYATIALFFVVMWLLPIGWGTFVVAGLAWLVIAGQTVHHGASFGTFAGVTVSALLAVGIMVGTRALIRTSEANAALVRELRAAQSNLAASERETGRLNERSRLGRELHDTVAQHLSSIQLLLGAAQRATSPEVAAEHVDAARNAAADALTQTRVFIRDLTPPQLADTTLAAALGRLATEAERELPGTAAVTCRFERRGEPRPAPMAVETALLRVAQESIANARGHGKATEIHLALEYEPGGLTLEVSDDGIGFDADGWFASPHDRADGTGYGLTGMRSRLETLGGFAVIVSEPGEGTLVRAHVPTPDRPATDLTEVTKER